MVQLITNAPRFFNDIADEIRLLMGMVEVRPEGENVQFTLEIELSKEYATGRISTDGETCTIPITVDPTDPLDEKRQQKRAVKLAAYTLLKKLYATDTPWGSLTGIRPTKLFREIWRKSSKEQAEEQFRNVFSVSDEKIALAREICSVQSPIINSVGANDVDVYIGIPFCRSRCLYCSFGSEVARNSNALEDYLSYLKRDIHDGAAMLEEKGYNLRAMYIGGGTPTVLNESQLENLLSCAVNSYRGFGTEFTVEAGRPDTITQQKLDIMRGYGVQRVSVNPQSMNDKTLRLVGRTHTADEIERAFYQVRKTGFLSINMDVIAGLPGESVEDFAYTLERVKELKPDNLTVHTLAIKRSSRLKQTLEQYPQSSAEDVQTMIVLGMQAAQQMDMHPYYMYRQKYMQGNLENVGYAVCGANCVYNVDMMEETVSILAHGAGAMSKRVFANENRVERIPNPKDVATYGSKLESLFCKKRQLFS
ncbi:MAG: coproporphyrinogen dehydrogenase HemZ [Eubacteriales bacterium]|nr:coproporphyrinogen dehydrogenase HemZ [Eubacteriales bacterium]